ncbi:MAG TPA: pyridoxal-phosphate dependent enzyme [Ktedonobacterales bacterium]
MPFTYICPECGKDFDPASFVWRCPFCKVPLDLMPFEMSLPLEAIKARPVTLWRYREALPFAADYTGWEVVTMGEGMSPLMPFNARTPNVLLKVEYLMPTLSFKDRGAAVLIAKARELGAARVIADSSGNAGTAIAAYAARAGLACEVYVPASASPKKLKQMAAHGATVHAIPGSREDTAAAAIAAVERGGAFYASHVYNPFFFQGTKTYAYELWEQLGGAPEVLVLPVGNGTLVLGAYYGFNDLLKLGLIERLPRMLAVQAEGCAPLARAFAAGERDAAPVVNIGTEAEGIAIAAPARHREILAAVRDTNGLILTVSDAAIEAARHDLARQGFYVEPTAAAPYAGLVEYVNGSMSGQLPIPHEPLFAGNPLRGEGTERVVVPLCGAGLKAG